MKSTVKILSVITLILVGVLTFYVVKMQKEIDSLLAEKNEINKNVQNIIEVLAEVDTTLKFEIISAKYIASDPIITSGVVGDEGGQEVTYKLESVSGTDTIKITARHFYPYKDGESTMFNFRPGQYVKLSELESK